MADTLLGNVTIQTATPVMTEQVDLTKDIVEIKDKPTTAKVVVEEKKMNILPYLIGAGVLYFIISKKFFKK